MPLKEKDYTNDEGLKDKSLLLDDEDKKKYKLKFKGTVGVIDEA